MGLLDDTLKEKMFQEAFATCFGDVDFQRKYFCKWIQIMRGSTQQKKSRANDEQLTIVCAAWSAVA